ncbi:hypothetical protein Bca4012_062941 [Brassica carinata]
MKQEVGDPLKKRRVWETKLERIGEKHGEQSQDPWKKPPSSFPEELVRKAQLVNFSTKRTLMFLCVKQILQRTGMVKSLFVSSRRHETRDWVFNIEKKYNRSLSQICDGIVAGYKREKMEKVQRHGQGGLQEQRQRENTERQRTEPQEHRQRDTTEWEKREAQENGHEHRKRDTTKWQRYFENKRREAEENAHEQRLMEIPENHKVDAHGQEDNLKVDRKRESIEWQTREAHEMERRKSKACLEEQRVKAKLDKKRKRDVEKLEVEADKSSEEQRLKENATLDSQVNKRGEEIRSQVIDETVDDGFKRARMERNPDLRPRKPDRRQKRDPRTWAEKRVKKQEHDLLLCYVIYCRLVYDESRTRISQENGNSSLRIKEPDQIPDHKDPHADKLKQPKLRDVERQQQRSHETESNRATNLDRERSEPKTISEDERIQSGYQVRPGERICRTYLQTGLCDHGSNCLFNHPTCKFFRRGFCKDGSACKFIHAMNNESPRLPNTVHQALPSNVKNLAEFSHPKDRDGAEPMRQVYNRSLSHEDLQEQRQRDNTEWQRSESLQGICRNIDRETPLSGRDILRWEGEMLKRL